MGRGGRNTQALSLSPLPPSYDQAWFDSLTTTEQEKYHVRGGTVCNIPYPYGAPRFVSIKGSGEPRQHTYTYHKTPEALLKSLLPAIRTLSPTDTVTDIVERTPTGFDFISPPSDRAIQGASAYTSQSTTLPAGTNPPRSGSPTSRSGSLDSNSSFYRERTRRANAISQKCTNTLLDYYYGQERFLMLMRSSPTDTSLRQLPSLLELEEWVGYMVLYPSAFVALYDLDLGIQPVPVRLGLRYVDEAEETHEVFETP